MTAIHTVPPVRPELSAFETALPRLLPQHEGQYVVMRGTDILHWAPSYSVALEWGYKHFGLDPFFVKQVSAAHSAVHFTRDVGTCGR